ncbi:hypothetical protein [Nocardia niwae]|uniref:hypothetical protein n=1 Tax=Nocardia niwae TaxID=626084 RepID=UPI0034060D49
MYLVWDRDLDQVIAILLDQAATVQRLLPRPHRRRVHAEWVDQQRPATEEEAAHLLQQLTAAAYRPHVLAAMPK